MLWWTVDFDESDNTFDCVGFSTISALVFFASADPLDAQENGTRNIISIQQGQQNQITGIGTASEIENFTGGNIPLLGNETDIQSQNDTSVPEGMKQEQVMTDTNMTR